MKGLVVKYGEKTYKVGLPDGGVTSVSYTHLRAHET